MIFYKECELSSICSRLSSGKNIDSKKINNKGIYPVYGGNGIRGYTDTYNFDGECAIIGRQGAFCGNVHYVKGKAYMTEHAVVVCADKNNSTRYLYYMLKLMNLGRLSSQSAQPGLSVKIIGKQHVKIPNFEIQKYIVQILTQIDGKIENNIAINDNLAELLQALYQQQFCCSNCTDNQGRLADLCDYSKAKVSVTELSLSTYYSTENMLPGKAGAVDAANLPTTTQVIKCQIGDVLISNIRPYFKKIVYCHSNCGCSMDVLCFTPKLSQLSAYLYSVLYADSFFDFMVAGSKGTKMPRGDKQQIMSIRSQGYAVKPFPGSYLGSGRSRYVIKTQLCTCLLSAL